MGDKCLQSSNYKHHDNITYMAEMYIYKEYEIIQQEHQHRYLL